MHAIRKTNLRRFLCGSEDVCRIEEGSTNNFLSENRGIEQFLKYIEPFYNNSIDKFRIGTVDADSIFVVAGFIAFVASCSPAAMRIHGEPLRSMVEGTANLLDARGELPPAPKELGGKTLSDLLQGGEVEIEIHSEYPQAIGITNIMEQIIIWGNSNFDILINKERNSSFFTRPWTH